MTEPFVDFIPFGGPHSQLTLWHDQTEFAAGVPDLLESRPLSGADQAARSQFAQ